MSATNEFFAHHSSYIDDGCEIGAGTKIWHFTHVMAGAKIGRECTIGQNVLISPQVVVGDNVKIQNNVSVYTGVTLEDDVFCGPSMVFTNVINPRSHVSRKDEFRQTLVRRGATLGANSTILCGHTMGRYAFVAAGTRFAGKSRCGGTTGFIVSALFSRHAAAIRSAASTTRRISDPSSFSS